MDKNLRVRTNVSQDTVVNVNVTQDVKTLEILSLNLTQENYYKLHESSYGVIIGRVLANDAFGIPNVKVSVFIKLEDEDATDTDITNLYPYTSVQSFDKDNRKYNLLPDELDDSCYKVVGTFPNKRLVLDDDSVLEVYDKYWKYTTVTNNAGDYMIFGIPTGNQEIHVDVDLSDIGVLSQKPRDMLFKGYNIEQFDSPTQFKEGTNLSNLSQIISQNQSVYVYPFWGDDDLGEIAISRCDIAIDYKFEPTCVFMGSLVTDNGNQQISHKCTPSKFIGFNRDLTSGEGTIEMIRKTIDGRTEDFQIKGNQLIDEYGVWCYQIPMNLDYVQTDEYGNVIPTDNPNKGIPTRTNVRFRISFGEQDVEGASKHRAKYLVPNNPELDETQVEPHMASAGTYYEQYYEFGSATMDNCFRNLYWNKVYSIKSFIPRLQTTNKKSTVLYTGIRTTNTSQSLNPFPFNKGRFKLFFVYRVICIILTMLVYLYCFINKYIIGSIDWIANKKFLGIRPFSKLCVGCLSFDAGMTDTDEGNVVYYPCCTDDGVDCTDVPSGYEPNTDKYDVTDVMQQNLAQEFDTVNFDFYNDWVNGCLYFPVWYWRKTKKKKFLFGLFTKKAVNTFCRCSTDSVYKRLKNGYLCALNKYFPTSTGNKDASWVKDYKNADGTDEDGTDWVSRYTNYRPIKTGVIKEKTNSDNLNVYYYSYGNITDLNYVNNPTSSYTYNRLFSTDIILLGSFNDCDLDGVPKLYRNLPTTTANIPFISKVTESISDDEDNTEEEGTSKDTGTVVITGMDWLHSGKNENDEDNLGVKYGAGLLMDLSCSKISTKPKSIINLERMSELGVSLDMSYNIPYTDGNTNGNLFYNETMPDGMITRYEINDNDSRYMFASLNHLGLDKLVRNTQTAYDVYKLGQTYPLDFDGMLETSDYYTRRVDNKTHDNKDINYVEFRLGEVPHAYMNEEDKTTTYYPLYNNSFYFYFGLNEGNTAIDKFKSQYDALCYQNKEYPFNLRSTTTPGTWCEHPETDLYYDYATIDTTISDISLPYSFVLKNDDGVVLFSGANVTTEELHFGYTYENEKLVQKGDSMFIYDYNNNQPIQIADGYYLTNGTYHLTVTDNRKQSLTTLVVIDGIRMNINVEKTDLGTKYYGYNATEIDDIANHDGLFGTIELSEFYIDGNKYVIDSIDTVKQPLIDDNIYGYNITLYCPDETHPEDNTKHHKTEHVFLYFRVDAIQYDDREKTTQDEEDKGVTYLGKTLISNIGSDNKKGAFNLYLDDNPTWIKDDMPNQSKRHNCGCQGANDDYDYFDHDDAYRDQVNGISHYNVTSLDLNKKYDWDETIGCGYGKMTFRVWIPSSYHYTLIEYYDYDNNKLSDNIVQGTLNVANGKGFGATLDGMPVNFMLSAQTSANSADSFYLNNLNGLSPLGLLSWYNLFKIDITQIGRERTKGENGSKYWHSDSLYSLYSLPDYKQIDKVKIYEDYTSSTFDMDIYDHITPDSVIDLNSTLLGWVFSLANATYSVDDDTATHEFKVTGGKAPYLIRCFKPRYEKLENPSTSMYYYSDEMSESHFLTDEWYLDSNGNVSVNTSFPDILSSPYKETLQYPQFDSVSGECIVNGIQFNPHVDTNAPQSNFFLSTYFAGFSKKGGFTADTSGYYNYDEDATGVERIPVNTNVLSGITPNVQNKSVKITEENYRSTEQILGGDDYNSYNSYFPAPFIDRRFDYDLYVFNIADAPKFMPGNVQGTKGSKFLEITFVHGGTYNGIELTYDDASDARQKYDIFQEDEGGNLEYAFSKKTRTGFENPDNADNDYIDKVYYFNERNNATNQHRFYSASTNGCDITEQYIASFRREGKDASAYTSVVVGKRTAYYLIDSVDKFDDKFHTTNTVNGRFDSSTFCTKRTLNYCVPKMSTLNFTNISCSYAMTPSVVRDTKSSNTSSNNHISCLTQEGETVDFTISTNKMISVRTLSINDAVKSSSFNILYTSDITQSNPKSTIRCIRLNYSISTDDICSTHDTLTCPQTLILSDDGKIYEYISRLSEGYSSAYQLDIFTPTELSSQYGYKTSGCTIDTVRLPMKLDGKFSSDILIDNADGTAIVYDDEEVARNVQFIIKNNLYSTFGVDLINPSNANQNYENNQGYWLESQNYKYMGIGGVRRYVNNSEDNLEKSIHLINFSKIYAIHPFNVEYDETVYTGTTDKVNVEVDVSVTASTTGSSSEASSTPTAQGVAECFSKTKVTLDFADLLTDAKGDVQASKLINGVKGKLEDTNTSQIYESTKATVEVEGTKLVITLMYYGLRPQQDMENSCKYWWQETYLKMYNGLIYCITYNKPVPPSTSEEGGETGGIEGPFKGFSPDSYDKGTTSTDTKSKKTS